MLPQGQARTARDIAGWRSIIGDAFGALDIVARTDRPFHGQFRYTQLGGLILAQISSANEDARRTRRHIASDSEEAFAFAFTRRGSMNVSQFGRNLTVPPASFTLLDLNSPYHLVHAEETELLTLKVPADLLRMRIPEPGRHVLEIYPATSGVARISRDLLFSLAAEADAVPDILAGSLAARVVDMFSLLVDAGRKGDGASHSPGVSMVLRRCKANIEMRIADPSLNPAAVAQDAGISVRYLHKLFSEDGLTFGGYLREQRLARSHRELNDPLRQGSSIKTIALSCGFLSPAHFSNAYKARYGAPPRKSRPV